MSGPAIEAGEIGVGDSVGPSFSSPTYFINGGQDALRETEAGPFANYVPYAHHTGRVLENLAEQEPKTLAVMHGSSYYGNGAQALRDLSIVMHSVLGPKEQDGTSDLLRHDQSIGPCGAGREHLRFSSCR